MSTTTQSTEKQDLLEILRRFDPNGYETLEGHETILQLREAVVTLFEEEEDETQLPALVRRYRETGIWEGLAILETATESITFHAVDFGEQWNGHSVLYVTAAGLRSVRELLERDPDLAESAKGFTPEKVARRNALYSLEGLTPSQIGSIYAEEGETAANNGKLAGANPHPRGSFEHEEWTIGAARVCPLPTDHPERPQRILVLGGATGWESLDVVYSFREAEERYPEHHCEVLDT